MTYGEAENRMKELCDEQFLTKLTEVARLYGWSGDYIEIAAFIEKLYGLKGIQNPVLEPYELEEDKP